MTLRSCLHSPIVTVSLPPPVLMVVGAPVLCTVMVSLPAWLVTVVTPAVDKIVTLSDPLPVLTVVTVGAWVEAIVNIFPPVPRLRLSAATPV